VPANCVDHQRSRNCLPFRPASAPLAGYPCSVQIARIIPTPGGVIVALALFVYGAVYVYPAIAVVLRAIDPSVSADAHPRTPGGELLLDRSVLLAGSGAILSILVSLPAAWLIGRFRRRWTHVCLLVLMLTPLLIPPMVYGFGWNRVLSSAPGMAGCVCVWAAWSWPIPAHVLGASWRRSGRLLYNQALLDAGGWKAFSRAVLPTMSRPIGVVALVLFVFMVGDYSVPHASGVWVSATVLLDRASSTSEMITVFPSAGPVVAVIVGALLMVAGMWPRREQAWHSGPEGGSSIPWRHCLPALAVIAVTLGPPLAGLMRDVDPVSAVEQTVAVYGRELAISISTALGTGLVTVCLGVCIGGIRRLGPIALAWSVCWAAVPGALAGAALVIAYLPVHVVYDYWPIVCMGYLVRYGWIGLVVAWIVRSETDPELIDLARLDGASRLQIAWRISAAGQLPLLAAGALIAAALSLAEVATVSLVQVPGIAPVSMLIVEKFHRFEDGFLVTLSLLPSLVMIPGVVLLVLALHTGWLRLRRDQSLAA